MNKKFKRTLALSLAVASISTATLSIQSAIANPAPYAATASASFTDVPSSHWAYQYIAQAAEKGWVSGTGNGRYNPTGTVSAAEFLSMVTRAFYPQDVAANAGGAWYDPAYKTAVQYNLLTDTDFTRNNITGKMNRYEMACVVKRVILSKGIEVFDDDYWRARERTADWNSIPARYTDAVSYAVAFGVLNGVDSQGTFAGTRSMDRAQAAVVLCKLDEVIPDDTTSTGPDVDPVNPTEPETPVTPVEPETPSEPETPVTPVEPENPVDPVTPVTPATPTNPDNPLPPASFSSPVGTISSEKVTYSYETHKPVFDYWSNLPSEIKAISDRDVYNAAIQSLKDQDKIRYEGSRTSTTSGYNPYYNYAVFKKSEDSKYLNTTQAVGRMSSIAKSIGTNGVPSNDGNTLIVFDAGWKKDYVDVLDPIIAKMPNGTDMEKAEYLVQAICDRFSYGDGKFTWLSGTTGKCGDYRSAVSAIFNRAGIPVLNEDHSELNHAWNLAYLDGKWYAIDAVSSDAKGRFYCLSPEEYAAERLNIREYPWLDRIRIAMAMVEEVYG